MSEIFKKILKQPEGRRIEFKEKLPQFENLAKTVIAFSNDAGGELYIGIKNNPREVLGISEDLLLVTEEKISNIISDFCYPVIIPEISFLNFDNSIVIRVKIFRGNQTPYYLKKKGKEKGVYIRIGSSNRLASPEMINELERLNQNISFDFVPVTKFSVDSFILSDFSEKYKEHTTGSINKNSLKKLHLIKTLNDSEFYTNAALLLANKEIKNQFFPYSKIECARFKGTSMDIFIDQQTIDNSIIFHAEMAIQFICRNISRGSMSNSIYREDRWEYPLNAIREAVINAIVHRDYSLQGKDIKIAIFDDMLEITSPGTAPPSIDFSGDLPEGQSDIRNTVLAPIFKKIGLIEQWGTGFKKIKESLKKYPEIELRINEPGLNFQIQFVKKNYEPDERSAATLQVPRKYPASTPQVKMVLEYCDEFKDRKNIQLFLGMKDREHFRLRILKPLIEHGLLEMLYPQSPKNPKQKYKTTEKGMSFLKE